jgi:hypothetical protein
MDCEHGSKQDFLVQELMMSGDPRLSASELALTVYSHEVVAEAFQ